MVYCTTIVLLSILYCTLLYGPPGVETSLSAFVTTTIKAHFSNLEVTG